MGGDDVGAGYSETELRAAANAVADTPEEAHELLTWAKPTSMMNKNEQLIMFAKVLRADMRSQEAHTEELARLNQIMEDNSKRVAWLFAHTAQCISTFFEAMQQPKLLIPSVTVVAFVALFALGQGDRAMDIAESLIEKWAGVDIHGHATASSLE